VSGVYKMHPPTSRKGLLINNDMKYRALIRSRAECSVCRSPCIVGKEHRWMKCNTCNDIDLCWTCFHTNADQPAEDPHPANHEFTDMVQLFLKIMVEVKEKAEKAAAEEGAKEARMRILPLTKADQKVPMASCVFCPNCGGTFDIHNPHNPRQHPDPSVDPHCKFALTVMANGTPLSQEEMEDFKCSLCKKILKAHLTVVAPSCRHAFCLDCAMRSLRTHPYCPVDGKPVKVEHLCRWPWMEKKLLDLEVPCINSSAGCKVICTVKDFAMHTESCEFSMEACKYRSVGCYFVAPRAFLRDQHEPDCIFQQLAAYIRRNENQKKDMQRDINELKDSVRSAKEQLNLLLQERDFCYSSNVFENDEDGAMQAGRQATKNEQATIASAEEIATHRTNVSHSYESEEMQNASQRFQWNESLLKEQFTKKEDGPERECPVVITNEGRTVTSKEPYIVLANTTIDRKADYWWWEVRVDTYPGVASVRVGFTQNPQAVSRATKLLKFDQMLGEDQLSFAWVATGSIRNAGIFLCQNESRLRYDLGDYLGFMHVKETEELHFFRNRVWAHKLAKLFKPYVDPVTKRQSVPDWYPAVSISNSHYSVTLFSQGPPLVLPRSQISFLKKPNIAVDGVKTQQNKEENKPNKENPKPNKDPKEKPKA